MAETGMVERVARAIAGEIDCVDWTAPDNTMSHPARLNAIALDAARAAIEAIRVPTGEMCNAGADKLDTGPEDRCPSPWDMERGYTAMIDAILKEGD